MSYERDCGDSYDSHNKHDQFEKRSTKFSADPASPGGMVSLAPATYPVRWELI